MEIQDHPILKKCFAFGNNTSPSIVHLKAHRSPKSKKGHSKTVKLRNPNNNRNTDYKFTII